MKINNAKEIAFIGIKTGNSGEYYLTPTVINQPQSIIALSPITFSGTIRIA